MRTPIVPILLSALLAPLLGCGSGDPAAADLKPSDLTLDQLTEKYAEGRGGRERLESLRTLTRKGRLTNEGPQPSDNVPVEVAVERPDHYLRRIELEPGVITTQAIDGDLAWQVFPLAGIDEPREMPGTESNRFRRRIDLEGALLDWQEKGHRAELLGRGEAGGREVYAVRIDYADGELATLYLDAGTFLPFREYERTLSARGWIEAEITYDDYREVGGVLWPFSEVTRLSVADVVQTIVWDETEVDVDLPASLFEMPADTTEEAAAEGP